MSRTLTYLSVVGLLVLLGLGWTMTSQLPEGPPREVLLAGYATNLRERTPSQRYNAQLAAQAIDNRVIAPGAVFSFDRTVKSWSLDMGYVKAPVSFNGELVPAFGGGVCQTSSTLYNAALLAGCIIVERHHHVFAPEYVTPGRDAAVAQYNIDLRFRNPYPWPIRIRTRVDNDRLEAQIFGSKPMPDHVELVTRFISITRPQRLTSVVYRSPNHTYQPFIRNPGAVGYRIETYRIFYKNGHEIRRERLGDDSYLSMNRVIQLTEVKAPGGK